MREDWKVQPETADLSFFKTLVFGPASYSDHALKSYSQLEREKQHLIVFLIRKKDVVISIIRKIQLVVYYQRCILIG